MLKSSDKIAIWMESSLDDDFGKMGISALRYLNNEIVCVIDSVFAGKKISEVSIIKKDIPIVSSIKDSRDMGANVMLLGVLTSGGIRPKSWDSVIKESIEMGMSIINGLHDEINPEFEDCDVALILGANDVVNPAARHDQSSPIYGMPILNVDKSRTVIINKRSMNPGFAGVQNELFGYDNSIMVFGDAKDMLNDLLKEVKEL